MSFIAIHLILTKLSQGGIIVILHFIEEGTKAQRGYAFCTRSQAAKLELKQRQPGFRVCALHHDAIFIHIYSSVYTLDP